MADSMKKLSTRLSGEVIAPDKAKPTAGRIPSKDAAVEVLSVTNENPNHPPEASEHWEVAVEYPDGFVKSHQIAKTATVGHLITAVRNQLKGRHGFENVGGVISDIPADLESLAGKTIVFSGE